MSRAGNDALRGIDAGTPLVGPQTLHLDVTNGCNTNCITCWDHSPLLTLARSAAWKRQRVELLDMFELVDDVRSLGGLRAVIVSGMGEPFTHPEIYDLLAGLKSRGLHVTVITNLIPADAERIIALDIDQLLIGIHGASEASYRAFHPSFVHDEWSRLHAMLARFHAAGRRYKQVQVICQDNVHELAAMVALAQRYDAANLNFKLASLAQGTETARITDAQRARLRSEWLPAARAAARDLGVDSNLDVFAAQVDAGGAATAPIADIGCFMGYVYARVLVDGTVLYCCNTEVRVGSLREQPFSELWRAPAWQALRERMRRGDYLGSCNQCGKLNQNVKLGRRFAAAYGEARLAEVTGRAR